MLRFLFQNIWNKGVITTSLSYVVILIFELNHILDFSDYRVDGPQCALKFGTMNKLRGFISWMSTRMKNKFELYAEHLIALTYEEFNDFRQEDMIRMSSVPTSPPPVPTTPMTTFTGCTKGHATSESQIAVNNFRRGTKRDASAFSVFKNDLYYDTFQRSFMATSKVQGLYGVADPDFAPDDGDQYDKQLFNEKTMYGDQYDKQLFNEKTIFYLLCFGYFPPTW